MLPDLSVRVKTERRVLPDLSVRVKTERRVLPDLSIRLKTERRVLPDLSVRVKTERRVLPDLSIRVKTERRVLPDLSVRVKTERRVLPDPSIRVKTERRALPETPELSIRVKTERWALPETPELSIRVKTERRALPETPELSALSSHVERRVALLVHHRGSTRLLQGLQEPQLPRGHGVVAGQRQEVPRRLPTRAGRPPGGRRWPSGLDGHAASQRRLVAGRGVRPADLALSLVGEQLLGRHLGQLLALLRAQSAVRQAVARFGRTALRAALPLVRLLAPGRLLAAARSARLELGGGVGPWRGWRRGRGWWRRSSFGG